MLKKYKIYKSPIDNNFDYSFFLVIRDIALNNEVEALPIIKNQLQGFLKLDESSLKKGNLGDKTYLNLNKKLYFDVNTQVDEIAEVTEEFLSIVFKGMISSYATEFYHSFHLPNKNKNFIPDVSKVPYAGRVFDETEILNLIDSSLEFWLTSGRYVEEFERNFSTFLGIKNTLLVNSGSSANLIAFSTLTSPFLKDRQIKKGDEVITVACGFPTTIVPAIQYGAVPVFLDVTFPTYNIDITQLEEALSEKTKAVMIAHTLGNPFDLKAVKDFCQKNNLWLIEDNCDALGSKYHIDGEWKFTGTIGDVGTSSFYPPHHMTMGEGGAVYMQSNRLKKIAESFRDWGRDCWCPSGKDNTCGKRFNWELGELPAGYDHKYIYSHFGYNLKVTEMQAAIGCAQLKKLSSFINSRINNWNILRDGLKDLDDIFILPEPTVNSIPSWFGFLLTIRDNVKFSRKEIIDYLEASGIQTRMLFAGNFLKHPAFDQIRNNKESYRIIGNLINTDKIMKDTFWLGVYPGLNEEMLKYMINKLVEFVAMRK